MGAGSDGLGRRNHRASSWDRAALMLWETTILIVGGTFLYITQATLYVSLIFALQSRHTPT
jgi:hypothetical protein